MATCIEVKLNQTSRLAVLMERVGRLGWTEVSIAQPVPWPVINTFLDDPLRQGEYFSMSQPEPFAKWEIDARGYSQRTYRQHFYFEDKDTAFEFKMRFG